MTYSGSSFCFLSSCLPFCYCCFVFQYIFTHSSFGRKSFNDFSFLEVEEGKSLVPERPSLKPSSVSLCIENPSPTGTVLHIVHTWQIFIALVYIWVYMYINIKILIHLFLISFIKLSQKCCYWAFEPWKQWESLKPFLSMFGMKSKIQYVLATSRLRNKVPCFSLKRELVLQPSLKNS